MSIDKPLILPIKKIVIENTRVKSFYFEAPKSDLIRAKPGQFVMVWIPGYDEKPFGIIVKDKKTFLISVAVIGENTQHLHHMKEGERLGFRGPYGTHFTLPKKRGKLTLIAGGYGKVPLAYLAKQAVEKGYKVDILLGAKMEKEFLRYEWLNHKRIDYHLVTNDGSAGFKGFVTSYFIKYLKKHKPDFVYSVGPEIMEKKIVDICQEKGLPFQISLERYIKCGIGLCGQCVVDPWGLRMCVEGPVVDYKRLKEVGEFAKYKRTASGKIINL